MAKKVKKSKTKPKEHWGQHWEPYDIEEWNGVVRQALENQQYFPKLVWLETKNGTLWPHKVVRE